MRGETALNPENPTAGSALPLGLSALRGVVRQPLCRETRQQDLRSRWALGIAHHMSGLMAIVPTLQNLYFFNNQS